MFQQMSNLSHVKGTLISSITNLVYELPHKLQKRLKTQDLRRFKNIRKISNLGGDFLINQCPVSLKEIKVWQQWSKNTQKQIPKFSCPVQFQQITLFCSKYFAQHCLSKQILSQTRPNLFQTSILNIFYNAISHFSISPKI